MKRIWISTACGLTIIGLILGRNVLKESGYSVHESSHNTSQKIPGVAFENVTEQFGIKFNHANEERPASRSMYDNGMPSPAVSVMDLNEDGYPDIIFSGGMEPKVYLNDHGTRFIEQKPGTFVFNRKYPELVGMIIWGDLNNDGIPDIILTGWPHHHIFYGYHDKNGKLSFREDSSKLNGYQSRPEAVNLLDFDQDGRLDIAFGNFIAKDGEGQSEALWFGPASYDNQTGGKNDIIQQKPDGSFLWRKDIDFKTRSYTHSVGVGDLNRDGYPDLFFANDYAHDELFMNDHGKNFVDKTDELIPIQWHGNSGMNGEVFDYNNDGLLDIYVTNIYKPPIKTPGNLLWEQQRDGTFKVVSKEKEISQCGFSWAAKFVDVDNDGQLDLLVTNGRDRAFHQKTPEEGESLWYRRATAGRIPNVFRQYYFENQMPMKPFYISAFEQHCLFHKEGDHYTDIAVPSGITDNFEGRGMAIADFNNDGRIDFVTVANYGPALLYMNRSTTPGHWLGLELINKNGSRIPIGAKVTVHTKAGVNMYREYYPANGYRAQSDWRLHFGLGDDIVTSVDVQWPQGQKKNYPISDLNKYIQLRE